MPLKVSRIICVISSMRIFRHAREKGKIESSGLQFFDECAVYICICGLKKWL